MMSKVFILFRLALVVFVVSFASLVAADDIDDARDVSRSILEKLENKEFAKVWDDNVSEWFKDKTTKPAFLGNMTITHRQLGGISKSRVLIQQNQSDGDLASGYSGEVFSFMYETGFPNAKVYETIVLIFDGDDLKLAGFNYVPNPN